jgi:hypothetical protein
MPVSCIQQECTHIYMQMKQDEWSMHNNVLLFPHGYYAVCLAVLRHAQYCWYH